MRTILLATALILVSACYQNAPQNYRPVTGANTPHQQAYWRCRAEAERILHDPQHGILTGPAYANDYMKACMRSHGYVAQ